MLSISSVVQDDVVVLFGAPHPRRFCTLITASTRFVLVIFLHAGNTHFSTVAAFPPIYCVRCVQRTPRLSYTYRLPGYPVSPQESLYWLSLYLSGLSWAPFELRTLTVCLAGRVRDWRSIFINVQAFPFRADLPGVWLTSSGVEGGEGKQERGGLTHACGENTAQVLLWIIRR